MTTWSRLVVLGSGSHEPGIHAFDAKESQAHKVFSLEHGDSAYSIAVSPLGNVLAVGTRGGNLYLLDTETTSAPAVGTEVVSPTAAYRSPILSLCFAGQHRLVVATADGTFWASSTDPKHPQKLKTNGDVVCALVAVSETEVFGLSPTGHLFGWSIPEGHCSRRHCGPPPGDVWGVVKIEHWATASALAYGAQNGDLVLCPMTGRDCKVLPAHAGELYAITSNTQHLLTAGRHDGRVKLWDMRSTTPVFECRHPFEPTSAAFIMDEHPCFVLVDVHGHASVFEVDARRETLRCMADLPGRSYRAVIGPDLVAQREERITQCTARIKEILENTVPKLLDRPLYQDVTSCCQELVNMGYPHVAMWVRAEIAARQENVLEELGHRHELQQNCAVTDDWSIRASEQYADLLMTLWRFREASNLLSKLAIGSERTDLASKRDVAKRMRDRLATGTAIGDPTDPLDVLIDAATLIGSPFSGRWVVARMPEKGRKDITPTPAKVLGTYQEKLPALPDCVTVKAEEVVLLSQTGERQVSALVFEGPDRQGTACFQFLLVAESRGNGFAITPTIVLSVKGDLDSIDAELHNRGVLALIRDAQNHWVTHSWVAESIRAAGDVMRRVITDLLKKEPSNVSRPSARLGGCAPS